MSKDQGLGRLCCLGRLQGETCPCLFLALVSPAVLRVLGSWLHHSSLSLCPHVAFLCVCLSVHTSLSLQDT